jgi:hypothetical protein
MKFELKRIEATLDQINALNAQGMPLPDRSLILQSMLDDSVAPQLQSQTQPKPISKAAIQPFPVPKPSAPDPLPEPITVPVSATHQPAQVKPSRSGKFVPKARKMKAPVGAKLGETKPATKPAGTQSSRTKPAGTRSAGTQSAGTKPATQPVHPFPSQQNSAATPALPRSKPPSFSSHRHAVNPNLAIGLLKEVETVVIGWQMTLEQTVLEIQALYMEGPIVDGWLESHPSGSPQVMQPIGAATLRHAEIDRLMDYVEEICRAPHTPDANEALRTGYRLCGLDADGQLWSRPCPSQQVPYVSLAIARYQKLRILFAKKQSLENRLNQLIQNLTLLHGQMQDPL